MTRSNPKTRRTPATGLPVLVTSGPEPVTGRALAALLGVDPAEVTKWKSQGCPHTPDNRYVVAAVYRWRLEREASSEKMDAAEAKRAREAAEAQLAELRLARERGEVVAVADVQAQAEAEAGRVRGVIQTIPTEWAPSLAAAVGCSMRDAAAWLRTQSDGILNRLATADTEEE